MPGERHSQFLRSSPLSARRKALALSLALSLPLPALALGLGDLTSNSTVGQRMVGELQIITSAGEEYGVEEIKLRRLSRDEAAAIGIELLSGFQTYRFEPEVRNGRLYARVVSEGVINEPFLNLVVELKWPKGQVIREYTLLLDIPRIEPARTETRTEARPASEASAPLPPRRDVAPTRRTVEPPLEGDAYRVQIGDSLSRIAGRWASQHGESRERVLRWLHASNPEAFIAGDINRLKAGALLRLPEPGAVVVDEVAPAAAAVATASQSTPAPAEVTTEPKAESVPAAHLSLSTPVEPNAPVNTYDLSGSELRAYLDATNEQLDRLTRENDELKARLNRLEKIDYLESLERLLALREQQLAELQKATANQARLNTNAAAAVGIPTDGLIEGMDDTALKPAGQTTSASPWWIAVVLGVLVAILIPVVVTLLRQRQEARLPNVFAPPPTPVEEPPVPPAPTRPASVAVERRAVSRPADSAIVSSRRPDDIVKQSIQNKMAEYVPPLDDIGTLHDEHDDIDDLVSEAMAYANRGQFEIAEAMIRGEQLRAGEDSRLEIAMHFIQKLKQDRR